MIYNVIGMRVIKKGFTLVELLVVMAVVAVLAAMTLGRSVTGNLEKGRDGRRQTDLEAIRSALEIYRSDLGTYPVGTGSLSPTYITTVPTDPKTNGGYAYTQGGAGKTYNLCATREITTPLAYCVTNP
ncbi:MAG: hypothetical protein UX93_C0005G0040 [Microgenomates group bacterium GW2011_GWC1_47_20]|uniref:Type II secretion system protein GspG C-terminal domain-containing protein n=1 Tax=Candidatus Amesbacteria bacterium GW2011_GWC2_45_19 TaxID=1618366 RepID=A0A0G1PC35_9BACT|nr:MAG: hypothetical protein UX05_C0005G0040 [Candidatus Amesbacteria bacterium GW2011_GWC2_45_19]KKU68804.1 MAG: hypothetical protein UX93_C0005G0040 [Microgenomates group bacterium GW2011_GWC1_47_20]